ncbi:hypothetical protein SLEP1_g9190 [Rubroshorea leprosula]|uniref:Disease resistance R13L4/SHOC-2-like LRR domain-containing protein n=1 Tax=Rubroshorea leprosula TaxID=152421 RepID=A0AAV5IA54_9ROSI|nr:hypothetical protein SLEP1_g9190 [Rubroshorea leprosula]
MSGSSSSSSQMGEDKVRNFSNLKHFADTDQIWSINKISDEVVNWLAAHLEKLKNFLDTDDEELDDLYESFETVRGDFEDVRNAIGELNKSEILVNEKIRAFLRPNLPDIQRLEEATGQSESQRPQSDDKQSIPISVKKLVPEMGAAASELKAQLKLTPQNEPAGEAAVTETQLESEQKEIDDAGRHKIPAIPSEQIEETSLFQYFAEQYRGLNKNTKKCLSCILVFPDDFVIRKTALRYWWMAEGLVETTTAAEEKEETTTAAEEKEDTTRTAEEKKDATRTAEEKKDATRTAEEEIAELIKMDFIEPVMKEGRILENKFIRMNPFIRLIVRMLAKKEKYFDSDSDSDSEGYSPKRFTGKVILLSLNQKSSQYAIWNQNPTNLETLFNVNQSLIDLQSFWLSKAKSLRVLQIGSWRGSSDDHVKVASAEFLESFVNLKSLRYLGLNMVYGIQKLPPSVSSLGNLRILDLKACHKLTKIPAEIRKLTSLTHLDMSGCYMIESMPKELGQLKELRVLKGFVVGDPKRKDACKIVHLTNLKNLRKLSVSCSMADAEEATELEGLYEFEELRSLTIAWIKLPSPSKTSKGKSHRGNFFTRLVSRYHEIGAKEKRGYPLNTGIRRANPDPVPEKLGQIKLEGAKSFEQLTGTPSPDDKSFLPKRLEKLDLRCYPNSSLPTWINPGQLGKLEKLYIRGGHLCYLKKFETVKTLRLRYLTKLKMDWKKLNDLFPDLQFLEKIGCQSLIFFPCNEYGEWKRNTEH